MHQALEQEGTMVEVYSKLTWKPDTFHVAVANCPDCLVQGYQGGCERQLLHQVQGGQAQVQGPDLLQTQTPPTQQQTTQPPQQPPPPPR
jgi:hypothetical protein